MQANTACLSLHASDTKGDILQAMTTDSRDDALSKVPQVTFTFWIMKILATTLGETGGDAVSMSMNLGYLIGTAIFATIFVIAVVAQISAKNFNPFLYWLTVVATTTVGTTLADFADRSLGIGYTGGSAILFALLVMSLLVWHRAMGSITVNTVSSPKSEMFYWVTILFSQTLGTALGDWMADSAGFGYMGSAVIFCAALLVVVVLYYRASVSHTALFWTAFILTRPLGATVGDLLDKPLSQGGLDLSRYTVSLIILALITAGVFIFPQRPARQAH